jgi:hypothetical protein
MVRLALALSFMVLLGGCVTAQSSNLTWYRPDGRLNQAQFQLDLAACEGKVNQFQVINPQAPHDYLDNIMRGCMAERGYDLKPISE